MYASLVARQAGTDRGRSQGLGASVSQPQLQASSSQPQVHHAAPWGVREFCYATKRFGPVYWSGCAANRFQTLQPAMQVSTSTARQAVEVPASGSRNGSGQLPSREEVPSGSGQELAAQQGELPDGVEASNVVALQRHGTADASHDPVDDAQILEECYPDTPEPARGKNKRSKE